MTVTYREATFPLYANTVNCCIFCLITCGHRESAVASYIPKMFSSGFGIFSASSKEILAVRVVVLWIFETLEFYVSAEFLSQTWIGSTDFIFQLSAYEEITLSMLGE
jgi:hypothetical protein